MSNGWQVTMSYERRRATFTLEYDRPSVGIKANEVVLCEVHGCFQCNDGNGGTNPYFVVELENGCCTYVSPERLTFIKEDKADV